MSATDTVPATDAHVEQVMRDVACPACEYNLRGLRGPILHCPECGHACDVAKLISQRWTGPWYKAPGFNRLGLPLVWLVAGLLLLFAVLAVTALEDLQLERAVWMMLWSLVILGWLGCFGFAHHVFNSSRGVMLALAAHVVFVVYLFTAIAALWGTVGAIAAIMVDGQYAIGGICVLATAAALVVGYFARRGERWIAEQCIREYLRRHSLASPPTEQ